MSKYIILPNDTTTQVRTIGPCIPVDPDKLENLLFAIDKQKRALADLKTAVLEVEACKHDLIGTSR